METIIVVVLYRMLMLRPLLDIRLTFFASLQNSAGYDPNFSEDSASVSLTRFLEPLIVFFVPE